MKQIDLRTKYLNENFIHLIITIPISSIMVVWINYMVKKLFFYSKFGVISHYTECGSKSIIVNLKENNCLSFAR